MRSAHWLFPTAYCSCAIPLIGAIPQMAGQSRPLIKIQCPGTIRSNIFLCLFRINNKLLNKGNIIGDKYATKWNLRPNYPGAGAA
jgi:hypothetical protein